MLCLRFCIDDFYYGFDCEKIVEIVPWIPLIPVIGAPQFISGYFNYRGQITPVVDLTMLIRGHASAKIMSNRIIVVNYDDEHKLGLLMASATETVDIDVTNKKLQQSGIRTEASYMGDIALEDGSVIQLVGFEGIISPELRDELFKSDRKAEE